MLSEQVFQPSSVPNSVNRQKSICHRMIDGSHFVFTREDLTVGVRGQLEGMGSLLPSAGAGVELRSSGLATNIFTASPSHQPMAISSHSVCVQKEHRGQERWTDAAGGFSSELTELGSEMLGVVYLGQCGWDTSGLRDPFTLKDRSVGPATVPGTFTLPSMFLWAPTPQGSYCSVPRFLPPATEIFTIGLGSFYY